MYEHVYMLLCYSTGLQIACSLGKARLEPCLVHAFLVGRTAAGCSAYTADQMYL